jgi:hypothetical protein
MPIKRCAALHAAQRADELMAEGDMEGRAVWHRIDGAFDELRWTKAWAGERWHLGVKLEIRSDPLFGGSHAD